MPLPFGCGQARKSVSEFSHYDTPEAAAAACRIALPPAIAQSVVSRRLEFLAGRWCAREALHQIGYFRPISIGMDADRAPLWPADLTGSITHAHGDAWAVAAPRALLHGIGIDLEHEFDARMLHELLPSLLAPGESSPGLTGANPWGWRATLAASLLFSAKESLYKCLAPLGASALAFSDASLCNFDLGSGEFQMRLLRSVAPKLPAGLEFPGAVSVEGSTLRTWVYWPVRR